MYNIYIYRLLHIYIYIYIYRLPLEAHLFLQTLNQQLISCKDMYEDSSCSASSYEK